MMLKSFAQKYHMSDAEYDRKDYIYELQDELANELSSLIAGVESGVVHKSVLIREIERRVSEKSEVKNKDGVISLIIDNIYGYGWLQEYIDDPTITDIDMLSYDSVMIRREGKYSFIRSEFEDERQLNRFLRYIVIRNGGAINEANPHCRVADRNYKLRINACIAPRNSTGASLTIRKHSNQTIGIDELYELGMFDKGIKKEVETACAARKNIVICGKGAAGKTTLLRAIIDSTDELERVLVCEKDAEIFPSRKNCIVQRISKRVGGTDEHDLNSLVEEGLTMSLDTYCIGEITGREAWPLVKAGFSDHRTLATIHAQSASDAIDRLLMLCVDSSRLSEEKIYEMILKTVDMVIYLKNFKVEEIYYPKRGTL